MANTSLRVIARIVAKPEKVEEVRSLLLGLIEPTRQEPGCLCYELLQNKVDPTDFTFIEEWVGEENLAEHIKSEHLINAVSQLANLLASEPNIRRYSVLA